MPSRRTFLKTSALAAGGTIASLSLFELACTNRRAGRFSELSDAEAAEVEALTALIIPSDGNGPGAREAGVVWYIDAVISEDSGDRDALREGLAMLGSRVRALSPGQTALAALTPDQQLEVARAIEDTDFFRGIRDATVTGMFAHPRHGGNRDKLGWQLLGFDDRHAWTPPFGHYDAPEHEEPNTPS